MERKEQAQQGNKTESMDEIVKRKIFNFKQAVAEGDIEERREAEVELREAFEEIGLGEELTKYLIAHIKRAVEVEKAYEKQCEIMQEVREIIRELARKV
jgi:alcohol dehydrogenase YqhD (iron-dependent ADH family)